jgi:hypothetical protein
VTASFSHGNFELPVASRPLGGSTPRRNNTIRFILYLFLVYTWYTLYIKSEREVSMIAKDKGMHIRLDTSSQDRIWKAHERMENEIGAPLTMKQFVLILIERCFGE